MLLGIYKISGHSMLPAFKPQDKVIASTLPYLFSKPQKEHVVLFVIDGKTIVKRIIKVENEKVLVRGDNGTDSSHEGWIRKEEIIGKVIFKV